jgi:hypothetical protein
VKVRTASSIAVCGVFSSVDFFCDGFQYQDPNAGLGPIVVNLFSEDRSLEFDFLVNYKGASARISQADLNRVIQTVHKVGPYTAPKQTNLAASR